MLCIPIIANSTDDAINKVRNGEPLADMLEIRLDLMESYDLEKIMEVANKRLLITYRSKSEGGRGSNDPEKRVKHLMEGIKLNVDMVDIELSIPTEYREKLISVNKGSLIVISTHIPGNTPSRSGLDKILKQSIEAGADIVKIVTWAERWEDNIRVLELIPYVIEQGIKIVTFCMGLIGKISRVLSLLMGAYFGFASLEIGEESAAGQIPIEKMKEYLEFFKS